MFRLVWCLDTCVLADVCVSVKCLDSIIGVMHRRQNHGDPYAVHSGTTAVADPGGGSLGSSEPLARRSSLYETAICRAKLKNTVLHLSLSQYITAL